MPESEELLDVVMDTIEEELSEVVTDTVDEELSEVVMDMVTGEPSDVMTDTVEEELLDVVTDMVAGAMASCFSVACMPARLCLKSLKSFLVIAIQSTMGELLPRSKWQRP